MPRALAANALLAAEVYRGVLGREPDPGGLAYYSKLLDNGTKLSRMLADFIGSEEFQAAHRPVDSYLRVDEDPPLPIELNLTAKQIATLWAHIAVVWGRLGEGDVYWSVISDPKFQGAHADDATLMEPFYTSGREEVGRMQAWLARNHVTIPVNAVAAEYGCGVGRASFWLAALCSRLLAFDISEGHLRRAQDWGTRVAARNVDYLLVRKPQDLKRMAGIDLFFSVLVLQHNPPPIIRLILDAAFASLNPGGLAFFQLPTYSRNYSFNLTAYLQHMAPDEAIEMHCLPQHDIFALAAKHDVIPLEIEQDGLAGDCGTSHTFLFRKR